MFDTYVSECECVRMCEFRHESYMRSEHIDSQRKTTQCMRRKEKTEERERDHQAAQERERNSEHAERERDRAREVHNTYRERVRSTEINRESYIQFSSSIVSEKPKFLVKA
jgi:FtsZ-interacting cell division protein YlmF